MFDIKNIPYEVLLAASIFAATLAALIFLRAVIARQLHKLAQKQERLQFLNYPEQLLQATRLPFLFAVAVLAGLSQLDVSARVDKFLHYAWIVILVFQVTLWVNRVISVSMERSFDRHRETDPTGATHLMVIGLLGRIALWSIALLVTLDNLGFNISTLMASLGIGGIAVALAVQNILGDVFSSVSIALDKPFVIGDFIVVEAYMGTVEYVGLKTTRIRSLDGEQIIFSNSELLKNRIRNYKRMSERRVQFGFSIDYETSLENIEAIPGLVKSIIETHKPMARFDRSHFKGYGDHALLFEVVYILSTPDFNQYMDVQQAINLSMLKQFRERGIAFAYTNRTLYMQPNIAEPISGLRDKLQEGPRTRPEPPPPERFFSTN